MNSPGWQHLTGGIITRADEELNSSCVTAQEPVPRLLGLHPTCLFPLLTVAGSFHCNDSYPRLQLPVSPSSQLLNLRVILGTCDLHVIYLPEHIPFKVHSFSPILKTNYTLFRDNYFLAIVNNSTHEGCKEVGMAYFFLSQRKDSQLYTSITHRSLKAETTQMSIY